MRTWEGDSAMSEIEDTLAAYSGPFLDTARAAGATRLSITPGLAVGYFDFWRRVSQQMLDPRAIAWDMSHRARVI